MDIAILMQHLESFKDIFSHIFDVLPSESLLPRSPCEVIVEVFQDNCGGLGWVLYFIQERMQSRRTGLKTLENVTLIM